MISSRPVGLTAIRHGDVLPAGGQPGAEPTSTTQAGQQDPADPAVARGEEAGAGEERAEGVSPRARPKPGPGPAAAGARDPHRTDARPDCPFGVAGAGVPARAGGRCGRGTRRRPLGATGPRVQARRQGATAGFARTLLTHSAHGNPHLALGADDPR